MADFLTGRTIFICEAEGAAVVFTISMSGKVKHKGSKVLTTAAKLSGKGICPILTAMAQGTPQPCKFQQTTWQKADSKCKAAGNSLLTANSFCQCLAVPTPLRIKVNMSNVQGLKQG